jgi:ATP-dependent DNA helicase RecG
MTKEELIERINDLEWEDFEAKEARSELPKSIWETVGSFSNTAGGWIVLGLKQNDGEFEVSGVKNIEKLELDFSNTLSAKQKFNVLIRPVIKKYHFADGDLLAFYIPLSDKKPVWFNNPDNTFVRYGSADVRASKEEIDAMYRDQAFGTKTAEIVPGSSIGDLNFNSVDNYRDYMARFNKSLAYNKLSTPDFLTKTAVLVDDKLTYSGLLFFGKQDKIREHFFDFRIDLLEIPGTSYSDSTVRYTYRLPEQENLWEYYFALFERINQRIEKPFTLTREGFASEDFPYLEALREATVNLLMHADYFSPAKPRVRVFANHIEFFNPGGLPKPLEILMASDISMPRNKIIAKLFRLVKLAENAGFGFDRMNNGWRSFSNSLPEYTAEKDFFVVKFFFNPNITQQDNETNNKTSNKTNKTNNETNNNTGHIEEYVKMLLGLMTNNPKITIRQLEKESGLTKSGVEWRINLLKKKGIIARSGSVQSGKWEILQLNGFLWSGENLKEEATKTRVKTDPKLGKKLGNGSEKTVEKTVVKIKKGSEKTVVKSSDKMKKTVVKTVGTKISIRAKQIIDAIIENENITREELAIKTGLSIRGVEYQLDKLKKQHRIGRVGSDKGGYWKIITDKN